MHCNKQRLYSITSSARSRIGVESSTPISFAVFTLTTSSNLLGRSTGKSAGLEPWRICRRARPGADTCRADLAVRAEPTGAREIREEGDRWKLVADREVVENFRPRARSR